MTSYPAFYKEKYTKLQRLSPKYTVNILVSLVTYHTPLRLYVRVCLVKTLTLTALIGSPIICTCAPADIWEQWERNLTTRIRRR